jgi:hypothetical protein
VTGLWSRMLRPKRSSHIQMMSYVPIVPIYDLVCPPPEAGSVYRSAEQHVHRLVEQLGHLPAASLCCSCR